MIATAVIVPSQMLYMNIPANDLRNFVDGFVDRLIPGLSHNRLADSVQGYGHRYIAGHDLLIDIPETLSKHGLSEGLRHAGHVIATDFPTKAGIPIPGFSQSGLGHLLEEAGIHRGWMQVNLCDTGLGLFAISEGADDLAQALQGALMMDWGTFFDTFVEGAIEISFSLVTQNPLLLAGGIENILAGMVASWNSLFMSIDLLEIFGAAGTSAIIGFILAYSLAGENLTEAIVNGLRYGTIGALYALSPAFGFGALGGFMAYQLGCLLAKRHGDSLRLCFSVDEQLYRLMLEEVCKGNLPVQEMLKQTNPSLVLPYEEPSLPTEGNILNSSYDCLPTTYMILEQDMPTLDTRIRIFNNKIETLPEDPPILSNLYQYAMTENFT